jgi:hypothetical protein
MIEKKYIIAHYEKGRLVDYVSGEDVSYTGIFSTVTPKLSTLKTEAVVFESKETAKNIIKSFKVKQKSSFNIEEA